MVLFRYDPKNIGPHKLAKLLGLAYSDQPGPSGQFYADGEPVGYVVRAGLISFVDEVKIALKMPLEKA